MYACDNADHNASPLRKVIDKQTLPSYVHRRRIVKLKRTTLLALEYRKKNWRCSLIATGSHDDYVNHEDSKLVMI